MLLGHSLYLLRGKEPNLIFRGIYEGKDFSRGIIGNPPIQGGLSPATAGLRFEICLYLNCERSLSTQGVSHKINARVCCEMGRLDTELQELILNEQLSEFPDLPRR